MNSASIILLNNASATGSAVGWPGGRGLFTIEGTFGSTSAQLQYASANGTFLDVKAMDAAGVQTSVALTANGGFIVDLPPGPVKVVLTGGSPSAMYARLVRVPV